MTSVSHQQMALVWEWCYMLCWQVNEVTSYVLKGLLRFVNINGKYMGSIAQLVSHLLLILGTLWQTQDLFGGGRSNISVLWRKMVQGEQIV